MGCQMNRADSATIAGYLEGWGWRQTQAPETADLVVVNTCVVRQSAEARALARIDALRAFKKGYPDTILAVTGCLVEPGKDLRELLKGVDFAFGPQAFGDFSSFARGMGLRGDGAFAPLAQGSTALVSVIKGCESFCTYCIVPYRRGWERSRPIEEVRQEMERLVEKGVKEITLLGQNVQAYGKDLPDSPDLADLLGELQSIPGLQRLRFLTSHPREVKPEFVEKLARLEKFCPAFSIPVQAGDDRILEAMGRGYTAQDYRRLVGFIREAFPQATISTDVIVGFPGETEEEFERTVSLLEELRLDTVHVAAYSPRPGTWASTHLRDSVPSWEKKRRKEEVEKVQKSIALEKARLLVGQELKVLVERKSKGRWEGRSREGRLVFFEGSDNLEGQIVTAKVEQATPWWLLGSLEGVL
jgi:tRNA-2-methylthio-N6-dimethylallyladenosine synthase